MPYEKRALPSAKGEAKWLCETYGVEFCQTLDAWCNKIVEHAPSRPELLMMVPIDDILDVGHKPWSYVWNELRDRTITDRLRSLLTFLKTRKPPFELMAVHVRILTQNTYWVNVIAVVRIDRVEEHVEFTLFTWYGDGD